MIDLAIPAAADAYKKMSTDQNLTPCVQNKDAVLETFEDDDHAQEEACKTEDHEREDSKTYQRAVSGGYGNLFKKKSRANFPHPQHLLKFILLLQSMRTVTSSILMWFYTLDPDAVPTYNDN